MKQLQSRQISDSTNFRTLSPQNTQSLRFLKKYKRFQSNLDIFSYGNLNNNSENIQTKKIEAPIRNIYNIINNQKIPQFYLKDRPLLLSIQKKKKLLNKQNRNYNIINGQSKIQQQDDKMIKKKQKEQFNRIFGRYNNDEIQATYQQKIKQVSKYHGHNYENRFPISYIARQPFIMDHTKPLSSTLQKLDQKKINAKKRYQMKYQFEEKYQQKNQQEQYRKQQIIRNKKNFKNISNLFNIDQ